MVTQNMLYTHEGKSVFSENNPIFACSESNQMPQTDQNRERFPHTCAPIPELPSNIGTKNSGTLAESSVINFHRKYFLYTDDGGLSIRSEALK